MPRLFTAIEIPQTVSLSLSLLRGGLPSARWVDPENFHLTLRFVGDVDARSADELVAALDQVERAPFHLALRGVGAFGTKKPHSIFARVAPSPELEALQADIDRQCRRLGFPADQRKFTPHVTLARLRQPKPEDVARYLAERGNFRTDFFPVSRFVLFSARESVGGGPYVLEEPYPLRAHARGADADLREAACDGPGSRN